MNIRTILAIGALLLCATPFNSNAATLTISPVTAHQVGTTATARVGILVTAESSYTSITAGGGYTLDCNTVDVTAENSSYSPFLLGYNYAIVHVPAAGTGDYLVGEFKHLTIGQCRTCSFQYTGRLYEGQTSLSGSYRGASFQFTIGAGTLSQGDTKIFQLCKSTGCQAANTVMTLLAPTGEVTNLSTMPERALVRQQSAEDGRPIISDQYALLRARPSGAQVSAASSGFDQAFNLTRLSRLSPKANPTGLLIEHQGTHEANMAFAPTPSVELTPFAVDVANGERGFAIIRFGASGTVQDVEVVSETMPAASPALLDAVSTHARTRYVDERTHDHTAYVPFEVTDGELRPIGSGFVTMPMCCTPPCGGRCP